MHPCVSLTVLCTRALYHCTVPLYHFYRTTVPSALHHCTPCTAPLYPLCRTIVPLVPYHCTPPTVPQKLVDKSAKLVDKSAKLVDKILLKKGTVGRVQWYSLGVRWVQWRGAVGTVEVRWVQWRGAVGAVEGCGGCSGGVQDMIQSQTRRSILHQRLTKVVVPISNCVTSQWLRECEVIGSYWWVPSEQTRANARKLWFGRMTSHQQCLKAYHCQLATK